MAGRLLAACAAALLALPAAAQDAICCGFFVNLDGDWIGATRDCKGALAAASPAVRAKACTALTQCVEAIPHCDVCDEEKIKGLAGRLRGLQQADRAFQKSVHDTGSKRNDARDRLWGKGEGLKFEGGSIADFGQAMLDSTLLASGGGGRVGQTYSKVRDQYNDVTGWAETGWGLGSNPGEVQQWAGLGKDLLEMQADDVLRRRGAEALGAARQSFQKTGNYVRAQHVYRQKWGNYGALKDFKGKAGNLAGALNTLASLYEKTDKVANDLQDWIDAYRDQARAQRAREKIAADIQRVTAEKQRLEALCAAAQKQPAARLPLFLDAPAGREARFDGLLLRVAAPPRDESAAVIARAQGALRRLTALQRTLRDADRALGRQVVSPFSPWLAGVWRDADPRLLLELVKASRTDLERFDAALAKLERTGTDAWKNLQALPRDGGK